MLIIRNLNLISGQSWTYLKRNAENFMLSNICRNHFHTRSNTGIMAGNGDLVNQSES